MRPSRPECSLERSLWLVSAQDIVLHKLCWYERPSLTIAALGCRGASTLQRIRDHTARTVEEDPNGSAAALTRMAQGFDQRWSNRGAACRWETRLLELLAIWPGHLGSMA